METHQPGTSGTTDKPARGPIGGKTLFAVLAFVVAFAVVLAVVLIGGDDGPAIIEPQTIGADMPGPHKDGFVAGDEGNDVTAGPSGDAPSNAEERTAALAAESFIAAIDERDGVSACRVLTGDAIMRMEMPKSGPDCADALEASLGYEDPAGYPVWKSSRIVGPVTAEVSDDGLRAKVVFTVATSYADGRESTVEDDIIYLVRADDATTWLVSGFGVTALRAIGKGDIPVEALEPPPGY